MKEGQCAVHSEHNHVHKAGCGHMSVSHDGHTDYLHDGHMHHVHGSHIDEHTISVGGANPDNCTPSHDCRAHDHQHTHGPQCGHERAPHGDHFDYVVSGHLHHSHSGHCDDHGPLKIAA